MTTDIATALGQRDTKPTLVQFIQQLRPEITRALPKHLDGDRMARLALTEVRKSELAKQNGTSKYSLADCTPDSFAGALLTAAAVGVEVGTPEAYLVPYKRECTLIIGYQGYTKLFWQHPQARSLDAEAVYERDEFDFAKGTSPYLKHKPYRGDGGRGPVIFYYAAVSLSTGGSHFEVLTPDEVKALRSGKVGPSGNIADPMRWMERKTAIRQVLKPMPKSVQLSQAVESDERDGSELYVERLAETDPQRPAIETPRETVNLGNGKEQAAGPQSGAESGAVSRFDPEPAPGAPGPVDEDNDVELITDAQMRKMQAGFRDLNMTDRADRLAFASEWTGRELTSSKEITRDEAGALIDEIDRRIADRSTIVDAETGEVLASPDDTDGDTDGES